MIFWIFVILTVAGIVVGIVGYQKNCGGLATTGVLTAIISGVTAAVMLILIIGIWTSVDGYRASYEQRYNALIYKSQTESIRDEFGIVNKEYIDEVQAWNEDLAKYQTYSRNFWIGIFYPKRQYEGFEFIDLESIKMRE